MSVFEQIIHDGAVWTVGDPIFLGILIFLFFSGFVMLQNLPTSAKVLIISGGAILGAAFLPIWVAYIIGLVLAAILFMGVWRWMNR